MLNRKVKDTRYIDSLFFWTKIWSNIIIFVFSCITQFINQIPCSTCTQLKRFMEAFVIY